MKILDQIRNPAIPSAAQELTVAADKMVEEGVDARIHQRVGDNKPCKPCQESLFSLYLYT